nr:nicotinamide riboside transporter PnuC [Mycoplasmopsis canis]WQQ12320.1 nicotinamide riboside transporter PnuC [Mycoplasmopsis canis]
MKKINENDLFFNFLKKWKILIMILFMVILIVNTLYSFDYKTWIWDNDITSWQKIIGISVSLSSILGVLSVVFFAMHKNIAYVLGIINAVLFAIFAFSFGLSIEGFINLFIYIPIMIMMWYKTTRIKNDKGKFESFRSSIYSSIFFVVLTIILTIIFYFTNPLLNKITVSVLGQDKVYEYGSNFRSYVVGSILNSLINALSIIALTMMVLGFRDSWIVWIIKNIFSFIFFGGVGFLNITTLLINVIYMIISLYLFMVTSNKNTIKIAFSNSINFAEINEILKESRMEYFELELSKQIERNYGSIKQKLKESLKIVKKSQFEDNVVLINYLLDQIFHLSKLKPKNFLEKIKILFLKFKYIISLSLQNKLDIIFVFHNSDNYDSYVKAKNKKIFAKKIVFLDNDLWSSYDEIRNNLLHLRNKKDLKNYEKIFFFNK